MKYFICANENNSDIFTNSNSEFRQYYLYRTTSRLSWPFIHYEIAFSISPVGFSDVLYGAAIEKSVPNRYLVSLL